VSVTIGYTPAGKRIVRRGSGVTKTEAKNKLKEVLRGHEDGLAIAPHGFTGGHADTRLSSPRVHATSSPGSDRNVVGPTAAGPEPNSKSRGSGPAEAR